MNRTNKFLSESYNTYASVNSIINKITDNAFISITEFSTLLGTVLGTATVDASTIYKFLCEKNVMTKRKKTEFISERNHGLKPSKYVPNAIFDKYYKKIYMEDYSFFIWDADFIFKLFNIEFKNEITKLKIKGFYNKISKCINQKLDINLIALNLVKLQVILKNDCWRYW